MYNNVQPAVPQPEPEEAFMKLAFQTHHGVKAGDRVQILETGEVIGTGRILSVDQSKLKFQDDDGTTTEFGWFDSFGQWKMLYEDMDEKLCFSINSPNYDIAPETEAV